MEKTKIKNKEFNIGKFKADNGLTNELQPYNYERYRNFNPQLTKTMYEFLRGNGSEWKILCGLSVSIPWEHDVLEEVFHLKCGELYKNTDFYKFRFTPKKYLALKW